MKEDKRENLNQPTGSCHEVILKCLSTKKITIYVRKYLLRNTSITY